MSLPREDYFIVFIALFHTLFQGRTLLHSTAQTNSSGHAVFPLLGLSAAGRSGLYSVVFSCDGVFSRGRVTATVQSSVRSLLVLPVNPLQRLAFTSSSSTTDGEDMGDILNPAPMVRAVDSSHDGVEGQVVDC